MTDAEKKVLDEEVVVESVDVEVGTMEDVDAIMKKFDRESNTRVWEGTPKKILRYVLAAFMLFMVYMNLWATWSGQIRRCLFVGFVILFTFFIYPVKKGNVKPNSMPWYDILLAVAGCIPYFYYVANFKRIVAMGIAIGQTEVILGIIGTLVLAECCRRAVGLPILVVAGLLCALRLHRPRHEPGSGGLQHLLYHQRHHRYADLRLLDLHCAVPAVRRVP